jgi:hypothetical protein
VRREDGWSLVPAIFGQIDRRLGGKLDWLKTGLNQSRGMTTYGLKVT